jgi:hypothetical protein
MKDRLSRYYCQALEIISPRKISQLEVKTNIAGFAAEADDPQQVDPDFSAL